MTNVTSSSRSRLTKVRYLSTCLPRYLHLHLTPCTVILCTQEDDSEVWPCEVAVLAYLSGRIGPLINTFRSRFHLSHVALQRFPIDTWIIHQASVIQAQLSDLSSGPKDIHLCEGPGRTVRTHAEIESSRLFPVSGYIAVRVTVENPLSYMSMNSKGITLRTVKTAGRPFLGLSYAPSLTHAVHVVYASPQASGLTQ